MANALAVIGVAAVVYFLVLGVMKHFEQKVSVKEIAVDNKKN